MTWTGWRQARTRQTRSARGPARVTWRRTFAFGKAPALIGLLGLLWSACNDEVTVPVPDAPVAAQGGSAAPDPTVKGVEPDSAARDTTLDIIVSGSGYDQGSNVTLELQGVPSERVRTNTTTFVNSQKLIANITIAADADTGAYDVAVTTLDGRRGIGIEMFTVTTVFPTIVTFRDAPSDNIRGDAELRGGDGLWTGPQYESGVCGVGADLGNLNDAKLDPDAGHRGKKMERECGSARVMVFEWDQPVGGGPHKPTRVDGIFSNIHHVLTVLSGTMVLRKGQFNLCSRLIFNPDDPWIPDNGSDLLLVSFDDKGDADLLNDEWSVRTQDYPSDKGYCEGDGRLWHMPFQMTIRRKSTP